MKNTRTKSRLTLEERRTILTEIIKQSTKTAIARTIRKDNSTIGKEIKEHRTLVYKPIFPPTYNEPSGGTPKFS